MWTLGIPHRTFTASFYFMEVTMDLACLRSSSTSSSLERDGISEIDSEKESELKVNGLETRPENMLVKERELQRENELGMKSENIHPAHILNVFSSTWIGYWLSSWPWKHHVQLCACLHEPAFEPTPLA